MTIFEKRYEGCSLLNLWSLELHGNKNNNKVYFMKQVHIAIHHISILKFKGIYIEEGSLHKRNKNNTVNKIYIII